MEISLPQPKKAGKVSLEETLFRRKSVRDFKDEPLTLEEMSQIVWAAYGENDAGGRTAPSAGALYPLEIYLAVRKVEGLEPGAYKYLLRDHKLILIIKDDISSELAQAALGQIFIERASLNLIITAYYERTTGKYAQRGIRYVHQETGHVAQNVFLQVESLGLGTLTVGAFSDEEVKRILNLEKEETPLYIMPIGRK